MISLEMATKRLKAALGAEEKDSEAIKDFRKLAKKSGVDYADELNTPKELLLAIADKKGINEAKSLSKNFIKEENKKQDQFVRADAKGEDGMMAHQYASLGPATKEQEAALLGYSKTDFIAINNHLRGIEDEISQEQLNHLDEIMKRQRIFAPVTTYRGVSDKDLEKMLKGGEYTDPGFVSTSSSREQAENFGKSVLVFNLPRGAHALSMETVSNYPEEQEILLNRGTRGKLTKTKKRNGKTYYYIDVV